jgi:GTPase
MPGLIAIVGRPNVGKSALFNRIVGKRVAIVHDEPGVTRDRISFEAEWRGVPFTLVDTGGIGVMRREATRDLLVQAALEQTEFAIEEARAIVLVVNIQEGVVPLDQEVADRLRRSAKPILLAVNKADNDRTHTALGEFAELGLDQIFPVSAIHGYGIEALMDALLPLLSEGAAKVEVTQSADQMEGESQASAAEIPQPFKLAVVGRPNVGKSSLINALTRSQRVVVTSIPGTTRDAVDVPFEVITEGIRQKYVLIDTAGVRQERRIDDSVEFYSVKRTEDSIRRCDLVAFMLDAEAGITSQDKKIADKIVEARKACIIVINKWDLVSEDVVEARKQEIVRRRDGRSRTSKHSMTTLMEFGEWVQRQLFFLDYAPVIFTSAKSGFHMERFLEAVRYVAAQLRQRVPTALLNRTLNSAIEQRQPVSSGGHRLKFFYATQVSQIPPTFLLFVNRDELFSDAYRKYLANSLRRAYGFEGCPLVLVAKPRPKTIAPKKKSKRPSRGRK